jgi:hypothetical protein
MLVWAGPVRATDPVEPMAEATAQDPAPVPSETVEAESSVTSGVAGETESAAEPVPAEDAPAEVTLREGEEAAPPADEAPAAPQPEVTDAEPAAPAPALAEESAGSVDAESATVPEPAAEPAATPVGLGSVGYDAQGRPGRIHVVAVGDTLWDISDAYLGTPWVWPSIWQDNREIANPHLIYPGDRIWITPTEMRKITPAEAEQRLARGEPAAPEQEPTPASEPTLTAPQLGVVEAELRTQRVSAREAVGLVSAETLEAAGSIVDAIPAQVMLAERDRVYIGVGDGATAVGDQFTIFRVQDKVFDPDSGKLIGYHVNILGWLEVEQVHPETSVAIVRQSVGEIERGDRVMPREPLLAEIPLQPSPQGVEGRISYFAGSRTLMGTIDFVYLNRGTVDGIEVGSPLEVYRPGYLAEETTRSERVRVPDHVVAQMVVVRARPASSVAFVTHTETELAVGDHFRGATR